MGGPGSRSFPDSPNHRGGRSKRASVFAGSGEPEMPADLPDEIQDVWYRITHQLRGVVTSQDSYSVGALARLQWQYNRLWKRLQVKPSDEKAAAMSLRVGRALIAMWGQFGMTPKARTLLMIPDNDEADVDPLDEFR
jgi:phage terminase small subunit